MDFETNFGELPYSVEAEQAVLGIILVDPDKLLTAMNYISADSFYIDKHKKLFAIIIRQFSLGVISLTAPPQERNTFQRSLTTTIFLRQIWKITAR